MEALLNSSSNSCVSSDLLREISASLGDLNIASHKISTATVAEALSHLKYGGTSLSSDHFLCASPVLSDFLSNLFTAMLRHGHVPACLRDCILQPIPKPGKDPSLSDNY